MYTGQRGPGTDDLDAECRALTRHYAGTIQQFRLRALTQRLTRQPLAVRHNTCGVTADRWRLDLDDGSRVTLRLYGPRRATLAALLSLSWVAEEGWRAVVRTTGGDRLDVRAFSATVSR
ncbi:MAG: hypothetical protein QM733_12075 [Ilumatobacteraceae bacterium]